MASTITAFTEREDESLCMQGCTLSRLRMTATPVLLRRTDGTLIEGVVDLAFREETPRILTVGPW